MDRMKLNELVAKTQSIAIPTELFELQTELTSKQVAKYKSNYGSVDNFLVMLYYLWFIEKKLKSEIAAIFEVAPNSIHYQIYNFMWGESQDWEISRQNRKELITEGAKLRKIGKAINLEDIPELKSIVDNANRYTNKTKFKEFDTEDEYLKVLAYYYCIEKKSPIEMVPILGDPINTIQQRLDKFGLTLSHEMGILGKRERGSHDYITTILRGKAARNNSQSEHSNTASKNQNYARNYLANTVYLPGFFDRSRYDVIIGCDVTGILGAKEIDIPIIVIDLSTGVFYKFALEYNGPTHNSEEDADKERKAKARGWKYIPLYENGSTFTNSRTKLQQALREILLNIINCVKEFTGGDSE